MFWSENVSIVDSTWFVPPPSREKIWREELCLGLVQNESKSHRLMSICTKPRKGFSRQILSLDKPSGIDNIGHSNADRVHVQYTQRPCTFRIPAKIAPQVSRDSCAARPPFSVGPRPSSDHIFCHRRNKKSCKSSAAADHSLPLAPDAKKGFCVDVNISELT